MSDLPQDPELLEKRLAATSRLVELSCALPREHDLSRILQLVTESVCEAIGCERASLYLYDEETEELHTHVVTELEIEEIRTSIENGITGWVARRQRIANIPDPRVDARWNSAVDRQTGFNTRNILAAPVVSSQEDRLIGVLQLLNKVEGGFDSFDERLLTAFAAHAATAIQRAQLLEEARHSHELKIAIDLGRTIQTGFLPETLPEIPGYEVAAWWQPAEQVSGDYYDLLKLPDGRLGLVIADVSGHGIGPSLLMASARAMLRVLTARNSDPHTILSELSQAISSDLTLGRFITLLFVALDPRSHTLQFANAGHGPAVHFQRATGEVHVLNSTALPLGFAHQHAVPPGPSTMLEPGDLLVMATDGVIEVQNAEGQLFGRERLEELIRTHCEQPAGKLLDIIRDEVTAYHPTPEPGDDITLLILERKMSVKPAQEQSSLSAE